MNRNARKLVSIIVIMLMIIPSTWYVYADDVLPDDQESAPAAEPAGPEVTESAEPAEPAVPEAPAAPVVSEPDESAAPEVPVTAESAESAAPEAEEPPETEAPAEETEQTEPEPGAETQAASEPAAAEATDEPAEKSQETEAAGERTSSTLAAAAAGAVVQGGSKKINISGTEIDGSADGSGNGWAYEKDSGRIVLRDYTDGADITSDGTGMDIVSTGFNRIGTLTCDGDINVIGAGILLIDKVELKEGCSFNLLPLKEYYGEDGGGVAVFLRQKDGTYKLVNGAVKGIIDERIELPEDVHLILPADSVLELQALKVMIETDEEGNETIIRDYSGYSEEERENADYRYYGGHLLTGGLKVEEGATLRNNEFLDELVASIIVAGELINNGLITGGSVTVCNDDSGKGSYSGSGTIKDSYLTLRDVQASSVGLDHVELSLEGKDYSFDKLTIAGICELYYEENLVIKTVKSSSGGSLLIYSKQQLGGDHTARLTGAVDGASVQFRSGINELGDLFKLQNGGTVNNNGFGGPVFNYSGINSVSDGTKGPMFLGPDDIVIPEKDSIPVVSFYLHQTLTGRNYEILEENKIEGEKYERLADYDASEGIRYDELIKAYFPDGAPELAASEALVFEVFRCVNGNMSMTVIGNDPELYEYGTDSDGVFLIRMAHVASWRDSAGGSPQTSTRANQTGSGIIGGNSKTILTGTGITKNKDPEPDPVKPDPEPDPKPDPEPDPEPDPVKPDPVKPDKKRSVATSAVVRNELVLRVDENDLNEDIDDAEKEPYYTLSAFMNGVRITELSGPVRVEMDYALPEEFREKPLYAVFANEDETSDETLAAVRAEYDEETGILAFETSQVGDFVIASLDFDGEEFSAEFYDELEKTEIAKRFMEYLKEKKDDAGV